MKNGRRKFLGWMAVAGSVLAIFAKISIRGTTKKASVRMLTQDGRLVEITRSKIPPRKAKATSEQVASWIWKDQKL